MSQAQDSVIPESTPASGASTALRISSVIDVAEDGTEYDIVSYYNNKFPADKAYAMAKEAVGKSVGNQERTDHLVECVCEITSRLRIVLVICSTLKSTFVLKYVRHHGMCSLECMRLKWASPPTSTVHIPFITLNECV